MAELKQSALAYHRNYRYAAGRDIQRSREGDVVPKVPIDCGALEGMLREGSMAMVVRCFKSKNSTVVAWKWMHIVSLCD